MSGRQKERNTPQLSIVFPCHNERSSLAQCIETAQKVCCNYNLDFEIIVADNASTDGSAEVAYSCGAKVVYVPQQGYGKAVNGGILAAAGEWVGFCDADGSYPVELFPQMLRQAQALGVDLLVGNRLKGKMEAGAMPFLNRYVGTPGLSALIRFLFHLPVYDCNGGMRILKRSKYKELNLHNAGMAYASEMICSAAQHGWKYAEWVLPVFRRDLRNGLPGHLRRWRDGWSHLIVIFSQRFGLR